MSEIPQGCTLLPMLLESAVAPAAEKEALDHPPGLGKRTVEDDHVDEKDVDRQGERTVHNAELLFYSCGECERGK